MSFYWLTLDLDQGWKVLQINVILVVPEPMGNMMPFRPRLCSQAEEGPCWEIGLFIPGTGQHPCSAGLVYLGDPTFPSHLSSFYYQTWSWGERRWIWTTPSGAAGGTISSWPRPS